MKDRLILIITTIITTAIIIIVNQVFYFPRTMTILYFVFGVIIMLKYHKYCFSYVITSIIILFVIYSFVFQKEISITMSLSKSIYGLLLSVFSCNIAKILSNPKKYFKDSSLCNILFNIVYSAFCLFIVILCSFMHTRSFADNIVSGYPGVFVDYNYLLKTDKYFLDGCGGDISIGNHYKQLYKMKLNDKEIYDSLKFYIVTTNIHPDFCYKYYFTLSNDSIIEKQLNFNWSGPVKIGNENFYNYSYNIENKYYWIKCVPDSTNIDFKKRISYRIYNNDFENNDYILLKVIVVSFLYKYIGGSI